MLKNAHKPPLTYIIRSICAFIQRIRVHNIMRIVIVPTHTPRQSHSATATSAICVRLAFLHRLELHLVVMDPQIRGLFHGLTALLITLFAAVWGGGGVSSATTEDGRNDSDRTHGYTAPSNQEVEHQFVRKNALPVWKQKINIV